MYFMNHDWEHDEDFIFNMSVIICTLLCVAICVWCMAIYNYIPDWSQPISPYVFPPTMD